MVQLNLKFHESLVCTTKAKISLFPKKPKKNIKTVLPVKQCKPKSIVTYLGQDVTKHKISQILV